MNKTMLTIPISDIMKLHDESSLYALAGIGAFVFTTMGSMLLKCLVSRRRQRAKDAKFKNEMKEIVEKTTKDVMINVNQKGDSVNSGKVLDV